MSRWIDADRLARKLDDAIWVGEKVDMPTGELEAVLNDVLSAPSIDIVFCKECKHREKYPCDEIEFYECSHLRLYGTKVGVEDDWFCADGEREGE